MQLPNWSRNLLLRRRRRREKSARQELFAPVRLSLRRLEERRVLDVSAAFVTGTGVLELDITNTSDVATVQDSGGNVSIKDSGNNNVAPSVTWNEVRRIVVTGDGVGSQQVVFDMALSLPDGLEVKDSIESTVLGGSVQSGGSITLESDVVLENDLMLVGTNLTFGGTIDSQPNATRSLTLDAGIGSVLFNGNIGGSVPLRGLDIQRADGGVKFGDGSPVQLVNSTDSISIGSNSTIGGAGVVFNGGSNATLRIVTTNDDVTINGKTTLQSNLSINTGSKSGDVTFTAASPIDSQTLGEHDLAIDAGEGSVFFNRDIGGDTEIGKLTITRAAGGVTIGDAMPVTTVHAANGIDIGVGTNAIAGTGIILNGGATTLTLETNNAHIRLNGPTTLASRVMFTTGSGIGDVTLTNDTPVDSQTNEFNDLVFDAGAGSVFVNEDLGRTNRLGSLTVLTAGGGVIFGQSTTEVPGAGGKGPVEVINTDGGIDIGVGTNAIGGAGVVFRGSAIARTTITTTADDIRINGPTTLGTDLTIKTSSGGGDLTFTSAATVDGVTGTTSSLALELGDGASFFNGNVGSHTPLGRLTVVSAKAGVTFGDTVPVHLVRTSQPIDIGVGTNVIEGTGITLNGGGGPLLMATSNADVRLNGAVRAQSDIAIDTGDGGGSITLTSSATINSHDGPASATTIKRNSVTLDAGTGTVSINANLGEQQRLGSLIVERAAGGVVIGDTGPVTQVATDGPISIGSVAAIAGGIALDGGSSLLAISTSADNIDFNGPIALRSSVSVNTGPGGGDLTLSNTSTLNNQSGEANDFSIALGTGNALLRAMVGGIDPLGELRIVSAMNATAAQDVHASRIVQQAGSGTTKFDGAINTTDATRSALDLTGGAFVFNGPVTSKGEGSVAIMHSGLLDINASADMLLEGTFSESGSGSVELAANIITTGDRIHFGSPVTLTDGAATDVLLDTTAAGNTAGAAITFDGTVNAQSVGVETLTLNAGTSGNINFAAAVGDGKRVGQLRIIETNDLTLSSSLATTNIVQDAGHDTTTFNGTVNTNAIAEAGIDISTANIAFLDAVTTTGDGRVELSVTGTLDLGAAADMNLSGSFLQAGGGAVRTAANITTSGDDITFTDKVTLRGSVRFDSGAGAGDLLLASTLDGTNDCQEGITLALGTGNAVFQDALGSSVGLGDVLVAHAADVRFTSGLLANSITQAAGSGETRFDGPVTIKSAAGANLATGSVTINKKFDTSIASGPIRITASDDITVNGSVTSAGGAVELSANDDVLLSGNSAITTTGAGVKIVADADASLNGSGGAVLMTDGAVINAASGVIDLRADENIQLGRLVNTTLVRLTSTSGAIVDGGDSGGADIVADRLALRSRSGVGTANPIDAAVNTIAAENKLAGGVRVENATGGTLTIGTVDGLSGINNGPSGAPAKLAGDVEIIHVGGINVKAPILNDGGSHTTVRAELPGDLTIDAPIQNRGGNGWIFLFSGGDLVINDSLPEPEAEISVENEGAVRGYAQGDVIIDKTDTDYVIVRTHSERFPVTGTLPTLSAKFADPAHYPPVTDTAFYMELEAELQAIRNSISGQATNFAPIFDIEPVDQGGSDIDSNGRGIVKVTIGDAVHLETNWHFTIDWGDGNIENYSVPGNPQASLTFQTSSGENTNIVPDLTNTARLDSGVSGAPGVYYVHHKYLRVVDPSDPSAPTPISATLRYDAREEGEQALDLNRPSDGSGIFNGIRFFRNGTEPVQATDNDVLTSPGEGSFTFIKVVESVIIPVEARQVTVDFLTTNSIASVTTTRSTYEFVAASFEAEVFVEYRLFMRVVDDVAARAQQAQPAASGATTGEGSEEYPLPLEVLDDPLSVFRERKFPNGHYRVYLEEIRTGRVRLILDVHIYEGRVVPENFRDGAAERQPGSDDSSQVEPARDPVAISAVQEAEATADSADGDALIVRAADATDQPEASADGDAPALRRSSLLLPVAASALPWRDRVRKALQSESRSISRTSLRLRRHR